MMNENCPCCFEKVCGIRIDPFTEEQLMEMHLHGVFLSRWCVKWYKGNKIYILNINDHIDLPFRSLEDIRSQFNKPISFYEDYLNNFNVSETINGIYYKGQCGHCICFDCYNMITENKCPCCRMFRFLKPAPIKTFQIGHIQWEANYNDMPYDEGSSTASIEGTPIDYESDTDISETNSSQVVPLDNQNINYYTIENCRIMINNTIDDYMADRNNPAILRNLQNLNNMLASLSL